MNNPKQSTAGILSYPTLSPELSQPVANALLTHMIFRALSPTLPTYAFQALGFEEILEEILSRELGDKWDRTAAKNQSGHILPSRNHPLLSLNPIIPAINPNYKYERQSFTGPFLPDQARYDAYCSQWILAFQAELLQDNLTNPSIPTNPIQEENKQ